MRIKPRGDGFEPGAPKRLGHHGALGASKRSTTPTAAACASRPACSTRTEGPCCLRSSSSGSTREGAARMPPAGPRRIAMSARALRGWLPLFVFPAAGAWLTPPAWLRWAFMWLLAFALYAGCKWLTWRRSPAPAASWSRHLAYLLAWPGLDAPTFLNPALKPSRQPSSREWGVAALKTLLGLALVFGVARLVP